MRTGAEPYQEFKVGVDHPPTEADFDFLAQQTRADRKFVTEAP